MGTLEKTAPRSEPLLGGRAAVWLVVAAVFIFYASALQPRHNWNGLADGGEYLIHGINIYSDHAYEEMRWVTPEDAGLVRLDNIRRSSYPPVYPALLGAAYAVVGLDFYALKLLNVLLFAASLPLVYLCFRDEAGPARTFAVVAFGFCPLLFELKETIVSEFLFVFLLFLFLIAVQIRESRGRPVGRELALATVVGILMYLAYGTRSAGIVLVPALLFHDLVRHRTIRLGSAVAAAVAVVLMVLQGRLVASSGAGYIESFAAMSLGEFLAEIIKNLNGYRWSLEKIWHNGVTETGAQLVSLCFLVLAFIGFCIRAFFRFSIVESFVLGYCAMLILFPTMSAWIRYWVPALPMAFLYAFVGLRAIVGLTRFPHAAAAVSALPVAVLLSYGGTYASSRLFAPFANGPHTPAAEAMLDFVRSKTGPDDVVAFRFPAAIYLFTDRRSASIPDPEIYGLGGADDLRAYMRAQGVDYVVLKLSPNESIGQFLNWDFSNRDLAERYFLPYRDWYRPVFDNAEYVVLEVADAS